MTWQQTSSWVEDKAENDLRRNTIMARLARVLGMADSVLSGDRVGCQFVADRRDAPSWTDGETISLSTEALGLDRRDMTDEDVIYINGLNYHELAHLLFTPRYENPLGKWARDAVVDAYGQEVPGGAPTFAVFNMLEDQRIERLLIAMYPATRPFLHNIILNFVLDLNGTQKTNGAGLVDAHVLLYGRRYIPQDIRDAVRSVFRDQSIVPELETLIDEYLDLTFPDSKNEQRAQTIILRVRDLIQKNMPPSPFGHSATATGIPTEGKTDGGAQKEAKEWAEWYESDEYNAGEGEGEEESESEPESSGSKKGKGKGKGSKSNSESGEDEDEGGDGAGSDGDGSGDDTGKSGRGKGEGKSEGGSDGEDKEHGRGAGSKGSWFGKGKTGNVQINQTRSKIRKSIRANAKSPQVKQEVADKRRYISMDDGGVLALPISPYGEANVDPNQRLVSTRFAEELEKLRAETDPGWTHYQSSGRVNMKAAMEGVTDTDVLFDQWNADRMDDTTIASAILLDSSSSMGGYGKVDAPIDMACKVAWVIKAAIEKIDGVCMLAQFDTQSAAVYSADEKADLAQYRTVAASGGTTGYPALVAAEAAIIKRSETNKMIWIVTDGGFFDTSEMQTGCDRLRAAGVYVVMFGLGSGASRELHHFYDHADEAVSIDTMEEMIPVVQAAVVKILSQKVRA